MQKGFGRKGLERVRGHREEGRGWGIDRERGEKDGGGEGALFLHCVLELSLTVPELRNVVCGSTSNALRSISTYQPWA